MKVKKSSNSNIRFLYGSVFFFAVIILVMMLFIYYAMKEAAKKDVVKDCLYTVSFSPDLAGSNGCVFLDDSLLYAGYPIMSDTIITAKRYVTVSVDDAGKKQHIVHFTESSKLRVEVECVDTVELVVCDRDVFFVAQTEGQIIFD